MCGRFSLSQTAEEILDVFQMSHWQDQAMFSPGFNLPPTHIAPVMMLADEQPIFRSMRWGLVPSWAKDMKIGSRMINARSETAAEKPAFRRLVGRKHGVAIAEGYYEWQRRGKEKTAFFIHSRGFPLMCFAALWDTWEDAEANRLFSFTILTTAPTPALTHIHDRRPVILPPDRREEWLRADRESALAMFSTKPPPLDFHVVSDYVNKVGNEGPRCREPIEDTPTLDLF
jgi:putative SOS response-associated peptidase YedK